MKLRMMFSAAVLGALALGGAAARGHEDIRPDATMESGAPTGTSIYNLDSKWTTQDGESVALGSFGGKPLIAAMGYTTCKDVCPAIVADMMWIDRHLPPGAANQVRFAFFSFDSAADTPERLKLYAEGHGFDLSRWTLLRSDDDAARELAAALGIGYRPDGQGGFDHAAVISLLDSKGEIVFQQRGSQATADELLAKLRALLGK
jgi:protein SCO1/2